jgi:uncharacterized membrane protein
MVVMVLDHTRDFSFAGTLHFNPTDLSSTTPAIFFTRWVTHFCAPVFVFLAGTGVYLQRARGKSVSELSSFLVTRGLWLILLEFTAVRIGLTFSLDYRFLGAAQVIWVIGVSMIVLAALIRIRLPESVIGALGVAMIVFHNLLDRFPVYSPGPGVPLPTLGQEAWALLHANFRPLPLGHPYPIVVAAYAVIPWVGVMAAGYAFGTVYLMVPEARRLLLRLGVVATLAFILVRARNGYGDPHPWTPQATTGFTVLSFLNVTKYPPSLDFLLMTLGPAILALAWFERVGRTPLTAPLITFGRVPLFFYLLQWPVAHLLTIAFALLAHKNTSWLFWRFPPVPPAPDAGFHLRTTYLIWITTVVLLYPLCRWFAGVKQRRHDWWVSYL